MVERHGVVVIGAGQAGLAMSWQLRERGQEHVVLERGRIGERWRSERWDSLAFQFPNWALSLAGFAYDGPDPDGFSHHTEVLARIERYAALQSAPVRENTQVLSVAPAGSDDGWIVITGGGMLACRAVVVATGPFQEPLVPGLASRLPLDIFQVHSSRYRNPDQLPPGGVLVVGSGGSGAQIAEELLEAGRRVHLAVNRYRRVPRRYRGRDVLWWLLALGVMDRTKADWPDGRMPPTVLVTGVRGGHDLDLWRLRANGAVLLGRLLAIEGDLAVFGDDAGAVATAADGTRKDFVATADAYAARYGLDLPPEEAEPATRERIQTVPQLDLGAEDITSVVWCTGYRLDFGWIDAPFLDSQGAPVQDRGVTRLRGLYTLGLHWMHTFKSGVFFGVGDDAAHIADHIQTTQRRG
jgi:putative flavoprotein involved in K+ transport